ncbi:MAG: rhomboid family intramembrane serine protease [Chlamydiia bacterium]|nr:rhomboid family intramembrane serine protease [Chlamydiia bacterium]
MVTKCLIVLNFLVFGVMVCLGVHPLEPTTESIVNYGGISGDLIVEGQWWRLLSYMFLHIGVIHLAMNMYFLYAIGSFLERLIGKGLFLCAYGVSGVLSGLFSYFAHKESLTVSAGASGAIAGIFGVYIFILLTPLVRRDIREKLLKNVGVVIAMNVVYGITRGAGIDHAAHIGGIASGLAMGGLFYPFLAYDLWSRRVSFAVERVKLKWLAVGVAFVLMGVIVPMSLVGEKPTDHWRFSTYLKDFGQLEQHVADVLQKVDFEQAADEIYVQIAEPFAQAAQEARDLAEAMEGLKLHEKQEELCVDMVRYIQCYEKRLMTWLEAARENTSRYDSEIRELNDEMEKIIGKYQKS